MTELRDWGRSAASWKRAADGRVLDLELLFNGTSKMSYPIRRKVAPPKLAWGRSGGGDGDARDPHAERWARAEPHWQGAYV